MVLQSVLSYLLNKYLGTFVENLDANQLNVGIWGGDVELRNLVLKTSALDELDLPVEIVYGVIGKLVLKIPWKNVYTSPSVVCLEGLYLLVQPNQQVRYDEVKEEKKKLEFKMQEIRRIEEAKKMEADKEKPPTKLGWTQEFTQKLVGTIIKNIQLNIKNIHVRYEDRVTNKAFPFSLGLSLSELIVESTDSNWKRTIAEDIAKIYKILQLEGLSVYFNCKSNMYGHLSNTDILSAMKRSIASAKNIPKNYAYVLGPINSSARLRLNQDPACDLPPYSIPKVHLNLQMEKLFIGISKSQYQDLIALADSMGRMTRGIPYRKYRPNLTTYSGHYKEWWHFAYTCVVEGEIKRRKRNWDWNHILEYRKACKEYQKLYTKQVNNQLAKSEDKARILACEKMLDLININIIRQKVQLECERLAKVQGKKTWLGWMWNSFPNSESQDPPKTSTTIFKQIQNEMTPDEKSKLYKAIDYQENAAPTTFPEEYVDTSVTFLLKILEVELLDDQDIVENNKIVLVTNLKGVKCKLESRPAASALKVHIKINDFTTSGMQQNDFVPKIIISETESQAALLEVLFEMNPLDRTCDQRIHVIAQPLKIIYDAQTINKIVEIFRVPPDSAIDELQDAATTKLSDVKEMTSLGLQYAIEKHMLLDLNIDLQAPLVIIPSNGKFVEKANILLVNLGRLKMFTYGHRSSALEVKKLYHEGKDQKDIFEVLKKSSYDNFRLELTDLQILIAESNENWLHSLQSSVTSNMHLLSPLTLCIDYSKCLVVDDPRLPLCIINGSLPTIDIIFSNARLILLVALITSIDLPGGDIPQPQPLSKAKGSSRMLLKYKDIQDTAKQTKRLLNTLPVESIKKDLIQFTTLEMKFIMSEFSLKIKEQETIGSESTELLSFKLKSLEGGFVQQTYVTNVSIFLGSIDLHLHRNENVIDIIRTPSSSEDDECLFKLVFIQVDEKCPELHSTYKSCESSLSLNFETLNILLHQEGLLSIIRFSTTIQDHVNQITETNKKDRIVSTKYNTQLSTTSEHLISSQKRTKRKVPVVVATIKFKLMAMLKEVEIKFATDLSYISSCAIRGIDTTIIVKDTYTQINSVLQEICIIDLNPSTLHKLILSGTEGVALTTQVVLNNLIEKSDKSDIDVILKLGGMRIFYMNWFVSSMLDFLNQFQTAQQKIIEASQAAAQTAKQNMVDVYAKATRVSLNINLKAPIVVVPVDSRSYNSLLLDMGVITLSNTFLKLDVGKDKEHPVIVDDMKIALTDLKVSRIQLDQQYKIITESSLLEPVTFNIAVKRNLSSWYTSIPDLNVSGKIGMIEVSMSKADYQMVMDTLSGNLAEGKQENVIPAVLSVSTSELSRKFTTEIVGPIYKAEMPAEIWKTKTRSKSHTFLKITFSLDHFIINLFTGGMKLLTVGSDNHNTDNQLARFSLEGLSLKGRISTDQSVVTSVLLLNCILDDMRRGREGKLKKLIEKSPSDDHSSASKNVSSGQSMIDVTLQQKDNDLFVDVRVFSFTIILSVDYLLKVADFFNVSDQRQHQIKSTISTANQQSNVTSVAAQKQTKQQMTINLKLEKPDIILVEHMDNINTNAMILNGEILVKLRQTGAHQVINGIVKELQVYTCVYNPIHRAETRSNVLYPVTISLAGSTPQDMGLHVELLVTDVHISVSPGTIELLNRVLQTMTSKETTETDASKVEFNYSDLWHQKALIEEDYWFLKTEYGGDALQIMLNSDKTNVSKNLLQELCIISMPSMVVTLEAGVGNKTLPIIMLEMSFKGCARNWTSQLGVDASLTMQMGYYNSKLALWEPLIEPEVKDSINLPWELKLELSMNQNQDDSSTVSPVSEDEHELQQTLMSIDIISEKNLELTITKTLLENLKHLGKAFASAFNTDAVKRISTTMNASYQVINEIGEDVTLLLGESSFELVEGGNLADINRSTAVPLQLKPEMRTKEKFHYGKELASNSSKKEYFLNIKVNKNNCNLTLPVMRADKKFFPLNYRSGNNDNWGIVCDINVEEGITSITLRSILVVHNHFNVMIDVYYMTEKGNELEFISSIQPKHVLNVPLKAVYNPTNELFFAISGYSVSSTPYIWKDLQTNLSVTKLLLCPQKDGKKRREPFVIKAVGEMEQVYYGNTNRHTISSACYNIHLRPAVNFKNCLPFEVICCVDESAEEFTVPAGDTLQLPNVEPGKNSLVIRLPNYLEREWSCRRDVSADLEEFSVWSFHSYDSPTQMSLDLGMHLINKNGSLVMSLYCPFWMLNKTGLLIAYKNSDENINILHHPAHYKGPILFSFNAKNFFGKKKTSIRIESGEWSDKFSLDVAGSSGVIPCKWHKMLYQIGVHNQLTYNSLTKQVTFTPYYVIINNAPFSIECQENDRPADKWVTVNPESCSALWPKSDMLEKLLKIRVGGTEDCTSPFLYTDSHTTLLKLNNKYGGINVDIQLTEGAVYISLAAYEIGSAPALLINHSTIPIEFWEKNSVQKRKLLPKQVCLYTWENPAGERIFIWNRGLDKEISNDLRKDMGGEFSPKENVHICWASFLDGMQRVLLFTEDEALAAGAQASNLFEIIQQEITVSLHGIGVSVVNNARRQEIMYMGIASSGVIWEASKLNSRRFKHLSPKESAQLERAYQEYLSRIETESEAELGCSSIDLKTEVDFKTLTMFKPHKRNIRRSFLDGLWLQMKTSPSQMQLHAKINRLQIDNQMFECVFPVVLAPVTPPRSVTADSGIKPFVEVSIVQLLLKNSQIRQFKYFKVLVQEFHVKVDIGFVNAILELLEQSENSDEDEKQLFLTDMKLVEEELYSHAYSQSIQEQKSFYDLLHFSPFKIHISFSMSTGAGSTQNTSTPNFINVLLQGLGVTLTDMQDVVFKLAFFERNYTFLTQKQLISEGTQHYVGQAVKQLYVLVLGLDVLGNPYGLVLGITKGVEDFFYEPIQGAIQGPGEFAEGLALGVKSLFGHTVGGAAGAMSRITGAMGKGIAALTFDDEFQRKRREQLNKKPTTAQEGIARSGKGLVMGVYSGVTGVFTKPVEGAKEQGVEGFFKGLGKGAVGLVARPVAGVVDFASGSFDVVKRATEFHEETSRLRSPRFLQIDGLVRPYNVVEAGGHKLLMELSKGKYAKTDIYEAHFTIIPAKEILLLTNKRVAYICHDIFGGWQVEWSYTWSEIPYPAKIVQKGILISTVSKKKRIFSSGESGKTIILGDDRLKEEICMKIESLRNNYNLFTL